MRRLRLATMYAFGSRLQEYRRILATALQCGYNVCSVEQSLQILQQEPERLFVLRHDVDQRSPGVVRLARIEAELGVSATYYFRKCTLDMEEVEEVRKFGHEVSFHYETIADYAIEHRIVERKVMASKQHMEQCADRLEKDLQWFRGAVDAPCRTLASHGAPMNRQLGLPNRLLFEWFCDLHERLEVLAETYDRSYLGRFDCYISDTQMEINDGFRYNQHPLTAIANQIPRIMMLTHPNHWAFALDTRVRRVIKCLVLGVQRDSSVFAEASRLRNGRAAI